MRTPRFASACASLMVVAAASLAGCHKGPANVDAARLAAADRHPGDWMSYGRTYSEQRFSPLDKINAGNVGRLGLAWSYQLATNRGVETTPIVVDGVMYVTSAWSLVYALDAKTGRELWRYDPKVPRTAGFHACCDVVNRGVAAWKGRIYVATLDGRLIALDAKTGQPAWSVQTTDPAKPYTITMAPRIVKGRVLVGNSGSEYGVRGYLSAYDADTGKLDWRFFTVPGDPAKGFESKAMAMAAKTWSGEWWKAGGGGSPWDAVAYDPETNLVYFGTGNGLPWDQKARSPKGGDNLFLASIVAVNADTGAYAWHYQTTPGDSWDFDSTQSLVLADLTIDGAPRKVVMQASKNGFFYVIDRTNGKLISARNFVPETWAKGIDPATGKPIPNGDVHYANGPATLTPSAFGGHSWQPMSFSPKTGLVYIPAQETAQAYGTDLNYTYKAGQWNTATNTDLNSLPSNPKMRQAISRTLKGYLLAWDPVRQKEAWRAPHASAWNGGTLATAGGLVFEGTVDGRFNAYDAASGRQLWSAETYAPTEAGPMTYTVDGEQYVAVGAGYGTLLYIIGGYFMKEPGAPENGRILVYKIGGTAQLPKPVRTAMPLAPPPKAVAPAQVVATGNRLYNAKCLVCHGYNAIGAGVIPDLRHSGLIGDSASFQNVVLGGALKDQGMVSFAGVLSPADVESIRAYLIAQANLEYAARSAEPK